MKFDLNSTFSGIYAPSVIRRLFVHNFRCLENFDLPLAGKPSVLLIGKNGAGKTTVSLALEILRKIARGGNRSKELVEPKDFARLRTDAPIRFEIEVELASQVYKYAIAFEFPAGFKELRIREESLWADSSPIFTREMAQVRLGVNPDAEFRLDWHLAALPVVQERNLNDPLFIFKQWLARLVILRPVPSLIKGNSGEETLRPNSELTDFGAWFTGLLAESPRAFTTIYEYLTEVIPDLKDIRNPVIGKDSRSLEIQFSYEGASIVVPFADLSNGEKCFMICAVVLAANSSYGPLVCFWDEPESHLALSEVGHFVMALRRNFQSGGQFIATSHNPEAIRSFSDENTLVLHRKSHLEPTIVRPLSEIKVNGDLVGALTRDDLEP